MEITIADNEMAAAAQRRAAAAGGSSVRLAAIQPRVRHSLADPCPDLAADKAEAAMQHVRADRHP